MELTLLGTSAGMPTKQRGLTSIALRYDGEIILFDCGEGTQRQMLAAGWSPMKVNHIFISHWHADHFAGLAGLIQTLSLKDRKEPLYVYGPKNTCKFLKQLLSLGYFGPRYRIIAKDVGKGLVLETKKYQVYCLPVKHNVPTLAFKFAEKEKPGKFNLKKAKKLGLKPVQFGKLQKGKTVKVGNKTIKPEQVMGPARKGITITYSSDTKPVKQMIQFARDSDLLIHEATFADDKKEMASSVGHSTASQAAEIAKKAGVKQLILTHISSRYKDQRILLGEARKVFKNSKLGEDLMQIELK